MQTAHFDEWIDSSVIEVLESMCFISAEPRPETGASEAPESPVLRCLEFRGPRCGSFGIHTTLPTSQMIACNLLGIEPEELSDEQAAETIGEITNMVCGAFLAHFESKQAFDLTHPHADDVKPERIAHHRISRTFVLEEGALTAWMEIEKAHELN